MESYKYLTGRPDSPIEHYAVRCDIFEHLQHIKWMEGKGFRRIVETINGRTIEHYVPREESNRIEATNNPTPRAWYAPGEGE